MKRWLLLAAGLVLLGLWLLPRLAPDRVLQAAYTAERRAAGLERVTVEVAGDALVYLEGGVGEPLVLLHGFGADKDNWTRLAKHLSEHFRVLAPDLPPFGESRAPEGARYRVRDQVARVRAFAAALELGPFHLAGNSMGGMIAGAYAAAHPEELRSLWLLAPAGVEGAEESELEALRARGENPLLVTSGAEFRALVEFSMVDPPYIPGPVLDHLAALAVERRDVHEGVFRELVQDESFQPLEEQLRDSAVPTLITWGDRDRLLHVTGAAVLAGVLRDAEVQILEEVGHLPMIERPEASAAAFLARLGR